MSKGRILIIVGVVSAFVLLSLTVAFGSRRIGNLYPVQGVFVTYCTDVNEPSPAPAPDCSFTHSIQKWVDLPGASYQFILPPERVAPNDAVIFARFNAQSRCTAGPGSCLVRMLLAKQGGTTVLMKPTPSPTANGLTFDSTSSEGFESHAVEQVNPLPNLGPGTYTVSVQVAVTKTASATTTPTFRLDSWLLATEVAFTGYASA